jgi:hypothetical protein
VLADFVGFTLTRTVSASRPEPNEGKIKGEISHEDFIW